MSMQAASSTIKINLPPGIRGHAQEEAKRIGISLQDFIRTLLATYFANARSIRMMPRDQELFNRAKREIQTGAYTEIRSKKELRAYFDRLNS